MSGPDLRDEAGNALIHVLAAGLIFSIELLTLCPSLKRLTVTATFAKARAIAAPRLVARATGRERGRAHTRIWRVGRGRDYASAGGMIFGRRLVPGIPNRKRARVPSSGRNQTLRSDEDRIT